MTMAVVAQVATQFPAATCVLWPGVMGRDGYGISCVSRRRMVAHRRVYLAVVGPIPDGLQLDHLCRTRACVNPAHLEPVTAAENSARARERWVADPRTHCIHGHLMDESNTYIMPSGWRDCRTCGRHRKAASRARNAS